MENKWDVQLPEYSIEYLAPRSGGQIMDWGHAYLNASVFYDHTRGERACVFVLDTAGDFDHPDLEANNLKQYNRNFTDSPSVNDRHGHGTHCAGIATAIDNEIGVIGIAPAAKLVAVKVLNDQGSGSYAWIASAIRYVADIENFPYRKIISLSLGGPVSSAVLRDAIKYAINKQVFVVAAAGNSGYKEGANTIEYPGRYEEVITVASLGMQERPSAFSSAGPEIDITAPGESVYSTHINGGYVRMSGTSMATPQVAGLCALILSAHPDIMQQDHLEAFLEAHAKDIYDPGEDVRTGAGAPIADKYVNMPDNPGQPKDPIKLKWWVWVIIGALIATGIILLTIKI